MNQVVAEDLKLTSLESFWAGIAFLLSAAIFQPVHTALSDIFGRKFALYECITFFVVGSAMMGWASSAAVIIAGRTIQGIGGGGMEALCEVVLTDITTLKERPLYIGLLGLMWAGGSVLSPPVGGLLSQYASWRWIAWINLPLMGISAVGIFAFLTLKADHSSCRSKARRVDWIGIALFSVGMTCFVLAIAWGGQLFPWSAWETFVPLLAGAIILAIFTYYERFPKEPTLSLRLFSNWTSSMAYFGSFIHGIILFALVYYINLYFQGAIQAAPFQTAIESFPLIFTATPMAIICAIAIEVLRRYMWAVWIGWLLITVGVATMALLDYDSSKALYSGLLVAPGLGVGILLSALTVALPASMAVDDAGVAMGTLVFFRAVGALVGTSFGSAIFTNQFQQQIAELQPQTQNVTLPSSEDALYFLTEIKSMNLSDGLRAQILQSYAQPIKYIWVATACLSFIGLCSAWLMKELTIEREEVGRQALERRSGKVED